MKNQNHENQFLKKYPTIYFVVVVNFCHAIFDDLCLKKIHPTNPHSKKPFKSFFELLFPPSHYSLFPPTTSNHVLLPVIVFPLNLFPLIIFLPTHFSLKKDIPKKIFPYSL